MDTKKLRPKMHTTLEEAPDDRVLKAIEKVKELEKEISGRDPEDVYLNGNCGNMFCYLRQIFGPKAKACIIDKHVYTCMDDNFYDVFGRVLIPEKFDPDVIDGKMYTSSLLKIKHYGLTEDYILNYFNEYKVLPYCNNYTFYQNPDNTVRNPRPEDKAEDTKIDKQLRDKIWNLLEENPTPFDPVQAHEG